MGTHDCKSLISPDDCHSHWYTLVVTMSEYKDTPVNGLHKNQNIRTCIVFIAVPLGHEGNFTQQCEYPDSLVLLAYSSPHKNLGTGQ